MQERGQPSQQRDRREKNDRKREESSGGVAPSQEIYEAVYQLTEEEQGWRVQGVQLVKQAGLAV